MDNREKRRLVMRYFLSRANQSLLKRLSEERTLCAFDFDGTLAPIRSHPDAVRMRTRTSRLLQQIAVLYPCVVVSGRARADVLQKLGDLRVSRVIGNHGAETETAPREYERVRRWKARLARQLKHLPGVWVEDKGSSLAVHYRQSEHKAEARRRILDTARALTSARTFGGKEAVNIVMQEAPNKGDALRAERKRLHCNWVLYVGDDETDEDAFALNENIVSVRIGRNSASKAAYYLRTQGEIDELLRRMLIARKP